MGDLLTLNLLAKGPSMPPGGALITGIPGVKVRRVFEEETEILIKGNVYPGTNTECPRCHQKRYRIKATRVRTFKHAIPI